ncbi:MAG: ABC transporter substrate-binding protein [Thermoguttaceae bacterium]|jgi:ABC-type transport system substrate-binding protein
MSVRTLLGILCLSATGVVLWTVSAYSADGAAKKAEGAVRRDLTLGNVKPAADDTLVLAYPDDPDTINPITASDTESEAFQREVYEPLAEQSYPDPDAFVPALATSWQFDEKKLEFTIHLRRGVKWQPMRLPGGETLPPREFTSRDVKFTFDCILNKHIDAAHTRSYYEDPDATDESQRYKIKVSVVDDYTVKIRWTKPYFMAKEFTLNVGIIPRHVFSVDENGEPISSDFSSKEFADGFNNHWANKSMCGTGPMKFKEWKRSERLVLERNANYWGRPYYFSRMVYRCISNPNTMVQELLQRDLDFAPIPQKDRYLQCKKEPSVASGKVRLAEYEYPGYRYIGYNMKRDLFKDRRVRQALSHAVPVQKIIDNVFMGLAAAISGPFQPGSRACDAALKPISYDLEAAGQLLDEAGWKPGEEGVREKTIDGVKVRASYELMIYTDAPAFRAVAEIIQENSRKIGVEVKIVPAKWALMLQKLNKKDFDAAMLGWAMSWKQDPFQLFHSSQADVPDSSNHVGYRNPQVDKLIEQLRVTMNEDRQAELYRKIHRLIYDDQPYTFLFADKATAGYDARIRNVKFYKIRPCVDSREWSSNRPRAMGE